MLAVMGGYPMGSVWILAQPIVEASPDAAVAPASFIGAADDAPRPFPVTRSKGECDMRALVLVATLAVGVFPLAVAAQTVAPQTVLDNPSVRVEVSSLPPGAGTGRTQGTRAEIAPGSTSESLAAAP